MLSLKIENLSSPLSRAKFHVRQDGKDLYHIDEIPSNAFRRFISYTKFRMLCPIEIDVVNLQSCHRYIIKRKSSFLKNSYEVTTSEHSLLMTFEPKKIGWKILHLNSLLTYEIRNSYGEIIGSAFLGNPTIIGHQHGEIKNSIGNTVAYFDWESFSFWKGYRQCEMFITNEDEDWILISILAAIIKGLYLQQR